MSLMLFLIDIYYSQLFYLKLIQIVTTVLHYLELIKLQLEHNVLYQLLQILLPQLQKKYQNLQTNLK